MKRVLASLVFLTCLTLAPISFAQAHSVTLSWGAPTPAVPACSTTATFAFYVFRGTSAGQESTTPINATPIAAQTYTDSTVAAGGTYFYKYQAVETCGTLAPLVSVLSNEVNATFPGNPTAAPLQITNTN